MRLAWVKVRMGFLMLVWGLLWLPEGKYTMKRKSWRTR